MSNWTQPCCEACWINREAKWEELPDGREKLVAIRRPVMVKGGMVERCAFCGNPTFLGIYVRENPAEVPYPMQDYDDT